MLRTPESKMGSMAIDNSRDKIREIAGEGDEDLLAELLQTSGVVSPIFAVVAIAKGMLDIADFKHRVFVCIRALCDELDTIHNKLPSDADAAYQSPWFKQAVQTLIFQTAIDTDEIRAVKLARATAHGCFPNDENKIRREDLASYIRDLAQLGTDDVRMLRLICDAHGQAVKPAPGTSESSSFRAGFDRFRRMAKEQKIDTDDTVALCARLSGFGLAYEIPRLDTVQGPDEQMFRPTRRGLYLLSLMEAAESPKEQHN